MKKETIVANTMREFKEGKLRSSSGDKVSDRDQAIAIALSKSGKSKYAKGGYVVQYDPEKKKTIIRTKKEANDFVEVLKKNGHTLIEVFKIGEESKAKAPATKSDANDIDDALTGAKTLLKFATASEKKEIETFIKGLEILKKMSGEPKTPKTEKMKTMSLSKDRDYVKEAKTYFEQEFDTTEYEDDLIKALLASDKTKYRTEKELEAEEYFSKTKFEDEFDKHIETLIEYSKKKPKAPESKSTSKDKMSYTKKEIIDFVDRLSYFKLDPNGDDQTIIYNTRKYGNVGSQTAGQKDLDAAERIKKEVESKFPGVKVEYGPSDEYVDLGIMLPNPKSDVTPPEKKQNLQSIKKQIIDFVEKNSWFESDVTDSDDSLLFVTRENGNILSESPGSTDIAEAKRLKQEIEKKFKGLVKIELEIVDEWVYINIDVLPLPFAKGGVIGQEIVFDDNGEENKGVIKDIHEITGDYIVATEDGRTVLASKELDVISLGAMRKKPMETARKRFGFFEKGGSVSKYEIVEGYDHYKNIPLYRVTDRDEYVGEWHSNKSDAEKELSGLKSKFNDGGLPLSDRFYVKSNFGHWSVTDSINNKMIVGYSSKEDAYKTANGLNQIRDAYQLEKTINLLQTQQGYGHFLNKYADGGNVRGMDWYQMWQPKQNKVVKVGDIVVHQHSKQPYKIIELLDDQYTVAKLDGNKEVEWKTFYEDFEDHKMFMPQQFGSGGTTLSQYIWNNHDLMIKGRYKVTGDVEAEVVVAGWEVGGSGKDEYLSMYQPSLEQNPEIMSLIVKRPNLRKMSNGIVVPATTSTGKKVKIQRIGGIYLKNDGQPY